MADERPVRQSSKVRVAEFLATKVGEGNVFTKFQLFDGVPGVAQADRRMRDLRELGWEIDNYKTDPRLRPDEYRLAAIGTRIDLGEQAADTEPRARLTASRRREALEEAGFACQICGISPGEAYTDESPHQKAVLGVYFADPTPPASTERDNLRVECQRCRAGGVSGRPAIPSPDEVLALASQLTSREDKRRLYRMMHSGRPQRDEVELAFTAWARLGREDRVKVMLQFAGDLIDGD
ncbi:hypothetical protein ACGFY6_32385 [Streptomyces sp. NPDC048387]|uniref:hypothetical protein n=1 Tax=Streptomyces sp. NPDC048387 TaxID=3365542 RepID=UPI00372009E2